LNIRRWRAVNLREESCGLTLVARHVLHGAQRRCFVAASRRRCQQKEQPVLTRLMNTVWAVWMALQLDVIRVTWTRPLWGKAADLIGITDSTHTGYTL
jgi:hypothetical protein